MTRNKSTNPSYDFRSWFSRQEGEYKLRAMRVWKDFDEIFRQPPLSSLCMPTLFSRKKSIARDKAPHSLTVNALSCPPPPFFFLSLLATVAMLCLASCCALRWKTGLRGRSKARMPLGGRLRMVHGLSAMTFFTVS